MRKRIPKEWRRLVAEFERGGESRRAFCERRALALSTLDNARQMAFLQWRRVHHCVSRPLPEHPCLLGNGFHTSEAASTVTIRPLTACVDNVIPMPRSAIA
ncbi:MAG: hypothetical protein KA004_16050 [Verrucomicrobiales bacterium]|nr:hypothetical protein [Verrucomicrobiales bacterium]